MLLEPFPKHPCQLTYVLLLTTHLVILEPIDNHTVLSNHIPVFWAHQEVPDAVTSFKMYLDHNLATCILAAFTEPLSICDHHKDVPVYVVTVIVSILYVVVILGLIPTMCITVVCQKSV